MPFTQVKKLASFSAPQTGGISTARIPTFGTIYSVALRPLDGTVAAVLADMKSELSNIKLMIDGNTIVDATPTFLLDLQKYYGDKFGAGNQAGVIPIYGARYNLADPLAAAAFALGTANVQDITVEVTCGTLVNIDGIELYYEVSNESRNLGQHIRINKFPRNFASTGDFEDSNLPKENKTGLLAAHIEDGDGAISTVNVQVGSNDIFDQVPDNVNKSLLEKSGRTPQSGYFHVAFDRNNDLDGFLPMEQVKDFRVTTNFSTAPNSFNTYLERVHDLNTSN